MTHSRYKYILWQEKPFTTDTFVQAHIKAFAFFGGRPQEMVYDQDKILAIMLFLFDTHYIRRNKKYEFDIYRLEVEELKSKKAVTEILGEELQDTIQNSEVMMPTSEIQLPILFYTIILILDVAIKILMIN